MANKARKYQDLETENKKLTDYYQRILAEDNPAYNEQAKFMLQLMNTKITQLEDKTNRAKILRNVLTIGVMVLSGAATVVLGLKLTSYYWISENSNNIALILTAVTTLLSGLMSFWDIQTYWLHTKVMLNNLKELRYELVFSLYSKPIPETEELKKFLNRLVGIVGDEYWEKLLNTQSEKQD